MRHPTPAPFVFTRTGGYLAYEVKVTRDGKDIATLPLFGPFRRQTIEHLQAELGDNKAAKVVAFGQQVENETWR